MHAFKLTQDEELHWLALRLVPGLGARKAKHLLDEFGTPQAIFRSSRSELEGSGISGSVAQSIASGCSFEDAVLQQQKLLETGTDIIPIRDPRYPSRLREIFDPPVLSLHAGRWNCCSLPAWEWSARGGLRLTAWRFRND